MHRLLGLFCRGLKVKMVVFWAIGVKICIAERTMVTWSHVLADGHLIFADAAEDCLYIPLCFFPYIRFMNCCFQMAVITGKIGIAAFEFYGYHVCGRMVVNTPGITINCFSFYGDITHKSWIFRDPLTAMINLCYSSNLLISCLFHTIL